MNTVENSCSLLRGDHFHEHDMVFAKDEQYFEWDRVTRHIDYSITNEYSKSREGVSSR